MITINAINVNKPAFPVVSILGLKMEFITQF